MNTIRTILRSLATYAGAVRLLAAVAVFASCGVQLALPQQASKNERTAAPTENIALPPRLVGVGSCTAAGCHGAGQPGSIVGSEYNIWIGQDPHARAYSVLFDERSQRMVRLLNGDAPDALVEPQKDARCLACHSTAGVESKHAQTDVLSDGVSCEACHGPAERWLSTHYQHELSDAEKNQQGMWRTDDLVVRTQTCVHCHVGGSGRDVNHDLIAAGHPRLQFEMGAFLQALPKHWSDAKDRENRPDFDTKLWAIGQACNSQAALEQLVQRADGSKTWPEFAEWSCSACHHGLRDDQKRQEKLRDDGNLAGQLIAWDTWNHRVLRQHATDIDQALGIQSSEATQIKSDLETLSREMRQLRPDRQKVAKVAGAAASNMGRWLSVIDKSQAETDGVNFLSHVMLKDENANVADWSNSAQVYNALASFHETRIRKTDHQAQQVNAAVTRALQQLFEILAGFEISPENFFRDRDTLRAQLMELSKLIPGAEAHP